MMRTLPDIITPEQARALVNARRRGKSVLQDRSAQELFGMQCRFDGLPFMVPQFKLLASVQKPRKDGKDIPTRWFFDHGSEMYRVLVEIDGGIWLKTGGAHSHPVDITRNMTKRNDAALAGYVVLAYTPKEVRSGKALEFTKAVLRARGWVGQ